MASACALAINSGRIIYISRLSHSAECSKRYFHGKGRRGKQVALPATPLFPKETGVADAALIYDPSCENGFQESPQTFLKPEIKITIPLNMDRAQRRPFKIVPLDGKSYFFQRTHKKCLTGQIKRGRIAE